MLKLNQIQLSPLNLNLSAEKHPNEMRFKGILVRLDESSTKAPNGSNGHKIIVPSDVAKRRLKTLIGMGLNYAPQLNTHAQRHKVGCIKKAWIEGKDLWVEGVVWKHDFPESEKDLKKPNLGMSMELGSVEVQDQQADTWILSDFYFLGATILDRNAAAYHKTLAIAAKADERSKNMKVKTKQAVAKAGNKASVVVELRPQQISDIAASAAQAAVAAIRPELLELRALIDNRDISAVEEELEELEVVAAKDKEDGDEDEQEACDMTTKKMKAAKKADDGEEEDGEECDDDEMDAAVNGDIDEGDLEEMGPETGDDDDDDDEPGQLNKGAKNKGSKTTSEDKVGKNENMAVTGSALKVLKRALAAVKSLKAQNETLAASVAKMSKRLKRYEVQATKMTAEVGRRSAETNKYAISAETGGLLAKSGIDVNELRASGQKLTPSDVDSILQASGVDFDVTKRIEIKNKLRAADLMEEGAVQRGGLLN